MHVSNDKCQGIELSNLTKTTDDSDHLEHSTEPTSVSRDPFDEANEYEDWSGNLSKRNFSLDYSVVARAFAQRPRNLRPDQIAMTGDHRLSRNVVSEQLPTSLRNTVQILAEKAIGSAIDWWPLTEPRRDFVRVTWSCVSTMPSCGLIADH
jgi:hypothetical protein